MPGKTLFDKIWDRHVIADLGDDYALLHISRHLMHDGGGRGLGVIKAEGRKVRNPELTFATFDHVISTEPGRTHETLKPYAQRLYDMREDAIEKNDRAALKKNPHANLVRIEIETPVAPVQRRYLVNDATVEALMEICGENPQGVGV